MLHVPPEAKRERVNVLTLQELNVKPEMVSEFKRRALALDFDAYISCSADPMRSDERDALT